MRLRPRLRPRPRLRTTPRASEKPLDDAVPTLGSRGSAQCFLYPKQTSLSSVSKALAKRLIVFTCVIIRCRSALVAVLASFRLLAQSIFVDTSRPYMATTNSSCARLPTARQPSHVGTTCGAITGHTWREMVDRELMRRCLWRNWAQSSVGRRKGSCGG